jgi:hypothetical protein
MVNNFTNMNKTNNHISFELNSLNTKKTTIYDVGNLGPDLGQVQKCGRVKPDNGIPTLLSS